MLVSLKRNNRVIHITVSFEGLGYTYCGACTLVRVLASSGFAVQPFSCQGP